MTDGTALACDLSAIPAGERERHGRLAAELLGSAEAVREEPRGFRLRLPADGETIRRAADFVSRERLCCPFLDFAVEVPGGGGASWLVLTGGEGVKEYLRDNLVARIEDVDRPSDRRPDPRPDPGSDRGPGRPKSPDELREIYEDLAPSFDRMSWLNRLVTGRHRRRLFGDASGRVLDVACGVGTNLPYLPESVEYVGVDLSPDMIARARARNRSRESHRSVEFRTMDAREMDFPDDSFDTVISSLSTCTFPDPEATLREMARVCRTDGRILLLEHGRSDVGLLARFQDWRADAHYEKHGCRWNQDPVEVVSRSGLRIVDHGSSLLGIVTTVTARPPGPEPKRPPAETRPPEGSAS